MIEFSEYRKMDAVAIAEHLRRGDFQPEEILECAIQRAVAVNPLVNAIVLPLYERARSRVALSMNGGPLAGVPFLVKDLLNDIAGVPTSNGSNACRDFPVERNSTMVDRFYQLGLNIIGKTNTPEFGLLATTEPEAFGATCNPWDLTKSVGGSSGGAAAAIASGIVPIASAGDGGGSIRIPASCCGLFGFKPSRGLNPMGPLADSWDGAVSEHIISRSVRDSLLVLRNTIGSDDYSHVPMMIPSDFLALADCPLQRPLRIAFSTDSLFGGEVHPDCVTAVLQAGKCLESLGHKVEESAPDIDGNSLLECYSDIYLAHVSAIVRDLIRRFGSGFVKRNIEALSYFLYQAGKGYTAGEYTNSKFRWAAISAKMAAFHETHDLFMTPVIAIPPFDLGSMQASRSEVALMKIITNLGAAKYLSRNSLYELSRKQIVKVPFTQLANITGQPAMSVPLYRNQKGLPIGVQLMAARLNDSMLMRLAFQLEQAQPWFDHYPD